MISNKNFINDSVLLEIYYNLIYVQNPKTPKLIFPIEIIIR